MGIVKKCTKCGRELTIDNFYKSETGKYGVYSVCKECMRKGHVKYYAKNLEKMQERAKVYRQRHSEKEKQTKIQAEMIETLKVSKILGGYRIYVLNHTKEGEFKYNALTTTDGYLFQTNQKDRFLNYLREIL